MGMSHGKPEKDPSQNPIVRFARSHLPFSDGYDGQRFFTRVNARRVATPLLLVLISVEVTDLIFAVDSIPAIFAITTDPFIVYTSNAFAILGLRALYFLLADLKNRFRYLKLGLAVILVFVGVKLTVVNLGIKIDPVLSLVVVGTILAVSILASWRNPEEPEVEGHDPLPWPTDEAPRQP
jgi:tellurite resistance protein TerC